MHSSRPSRVRFSVNCDFCFLHCALSEGQTGFCSVRTNRGGRIESRFAGQLCALAVDPVEKKPLYHFLPLTKTLSLASPGCSYDCDFCQNWHIARNFRGRTEKWEAEDIVTEALSSGCPSISFTYTEPLVWQDCMLDVCSIAKEKGLRTVMVTNGGFSDASLERILPLVDAYNVDLKGDDAFYRTYCHSLMSPVVKAIGKIVEAGCHIEVTTMVIEGIHTAEMIRSLGRVLKDCGIAVWHLTRFFPMRRMADRKVTGEGFLEEVCNVALESGIDHVYRGNSIHHDPLKCPKCGLSLDRKHFSGTCHSCGKMIYGVWE